MQTILGANGAIARALSHVLTRNKVQLRQVSRNPQKTNAGDQLFAADLFDAKATSAAVAGSDVVYLVVGLKYDTFTWQSQWPVVMQNVIAACKRHEARLVYLDNVYAYGRVVGSSTR